MEQHEVNKLGNEFYGELLGQLRAGRNRTGPLLSAAVTADGDMLAVVLEYARGDEEAETDSAD